MNSKKLFRKNFEYSKSQEAKNFQYWNCRFRIRAQRSWPLFSFFVVVFFKTKIPHKHLITMRETAWNVNLMNDHHLLDDIATFIA